MSIDIIKFIEKHRDEFGDPNVEGPRGVFLDNLIDRLRREMEQDYVGELYRTDYSVTGRGAFPLDMLRYTSSWPKDESDVFAIEHSLDSDFDDSEQYTVRLTKYHRDPKPKLAEDRWISKFRWKVVDSSAETSKL